MSLAFSESAKEWEQGMQVAEAIKSAGESAAVIEEKQSEDGMTSGRDRQWDDHAVREVKKQNDVRLGEGHNKGGELSAAPEKEPGMKFDSSKPDMRLIPPLAELEMAKVLTFGAEKYAPGNWKKVEPERYISAAMRHINAIRQGELVDSESGCHHAAHLMCCAAFIVELMKPSISFTISLSDMEKNPSMGLDTEIGKAVTKAITGSKGPELTPNKGSKIPADALDVALDRSRH